MQTAVHAVTEIVNTDRPLRELRKYFPDKTSGLTYYANRLQAQFTAGAATDECVLCDQPGKVVQFYQWKTVTEHQVNFGWVDLAMLLLFGRVRISVDHTVVEFETVHRVCEACARWTLLRRALALLIRALAALLLVTGALVSLVLGGICGFVIVVDGWPMPQYMAGTEWVLGASVAALLWVWPLMWWVKMLRVPKRLRVIGRRPFRLECVITPETTGSR